jgi:hypothetical protein
MVRYLLTYVLRELPLRILWTALQIFWPTESIQVSAPQYPRANSRHVFHCSDVCRRWKQRDTSASLQVVDASQRTIVLLLVSCCSFRHATSRLEEQCIVSPLFYWFLSSLASRYVALCPSWFFVSLSRRRVSTMALSRICILRWMYSSTGPQDHISYPQTMTEPITPRQERIAPDASSGINELITVGNKNDRFKLLEDDSVLPGNLDNSIHPVFEWFVAEGPMKQMLQLASHFIAHDSLLAFFVPLIYGRELIGTAASTSKTYLSDLIANVSEQIRTEYLAGVREALRCLAYSIRFRFQPPAKRVYARTIRDNERPAHGTSCCPAF